MTDVKILREEVLSDDHFSLKKIAFERTFRNGMRHVVEREIYCRGDAVCVLLVDPVRRLVALTRQFRPPAFINGGLDGLIEACAGRLEGDTPQECAVREVAEEMGYAIAPPTPLFAAFMTPGSVTEKITFFVAQYSPEARTGPGGGLAEEGEDIEVLEYGLDEALAMVARGEIMDAKTIVLLQYAKLHGVLG